MITATNCSIGRTGYREGLEAAPTTRVEMWWPFAHPDPTDDEIRGVVAELERRGKQLIALNMFGGDLAAGDRGVLHEQDLPAAHLDAVERFHELTGVRRSSGAREPGSQRTRNGGSRRWRATSISDSGEWPWWSPCPRPPTTP